LCPLIYEVLERLLFVKREILKAFLLVANFCTPSKARECVQELLRRPPPVQLALLAAPPSSPRLSGRSLSGCAGKRSCAKRVRKKAAANKNRNKNKPAQIFAFSMPEGGVLPRSRLPHAEVAWQEWGVSDNSKK
jgi:hypothetical protein